MSGDPTDDSTSIFVKAIKGILRPFVRALIAQGITAPAFYRIVKQTYVDVSLETLGKDATDSRISVMTGVHRRDVKQFRSDSSPEDADLRRKVSTLTTVVGRWMASAETTDDAGQPIALPRSGDSGMTFESLVQSVSRDIRPRTILDELIRQDIVTQTDNMIILRPDALIGPADIDQRLHYFAENLGDHMNAAVENLFSDDPPNLERAVFYNGLSDASVVEIEAEARRLSNDALQTLNKQAREKQAADVAAGRSTNRFRFGVFFFREDKEDGPEGKDHHERP